MANNNEHWRAHIDPDWFSFVEYFAAQCHKYVEAEGKAFIAFWIPCACCSYEDGIAIHPYSGKYVIFSNLSEKGEIWVDLWLEGESIVSFTIEESLEVFEDTFGSAIKPEPETALGIWLEGSACLYENAAIRLIPFMATTLKISARQASDAFADWQMDFE